jgi:hypothetical protein
MSSVMPSAKNSCSASPLKLANGRTAIARLSSNSGGLATAVSGLPTSDFFPAHLVDANGSLNVFESLRAEVGEIEIYLAANLIVDVLGDVDATWLGKGLEPRRDIDAVAEDITGLEDDIAKIDSDTQRDPLLGRHNLVLVRGGIAQERGVAGGLDDAVELDERPFAGPIDHLSAEFGDPRLDDLGHKRSQPGEPVRLVAGKQGGVAGDQDRRKSASDARSRLLGQAEHLLHHGSDIGPRSVDPM